MRSAPAAPGRCQSLAKAIGLPAAGAGPDEAAAALVAFVRDLAGRLEIPTLRGAGVDPERLLAVAPQMAADALASGSPANNPRPASVEEMIALYRAAL